MIGTTGVDSGVSAAVLKAAKHFESLGAIVERISLPTLALGLPAYYIIAPSEASSNLSRYDGVRFGSRIEGAENLQSLYTMYRGEGFGPEVKRRVLMGTYALSAGQQDMYYRKAQQVRTLIRCDDSTCFSQFRL